MSDEYPSVAGELGKLVLAVLGLVLSHPLLSWGPIGWLVLVVIAFVASSIRTGDGDVSDAPDRGVVRPRPPARRVTATEPVRATAEA